MPIPKVSAPVQPKAKVSYYKKPENLSLDRWQYELRKQFGEEHEFSIKNIGHEPYYSDYQVYNYETKNYYKVSLRSATDIANFCECLDFKTNQLGICKHISAVRHYLNNSSDLQKFAKKAPELQSYTSVYLDYRHGRQIKLRIGTEQESEFQKLAKIYFDSNLCLLAAAYGAFETFLKAAQELSPDFRCYADALELVLEHRLKKNRIEYLDKQTVKKGDAAIFEEFLKVKLYPYQVEGAIFAAKAGRSLIADEMGLGKTIQAIAVAEFYKHKMGIERVLIVSPTSLKYQWKSEIEKFTHSSVEIIEGDYSIRKKYYENSKSFYQIVSYHAVSQDIIPINACEYDLLILDEAQRIKNWKTKVSKAVKRINTPYAVVLTGTPLENKLEELYSIIQLIDVYRLGPIYRFLNHHQIKNEETGKVIGYQNLSEIQAKLSDIVIRRRKKQVALQMPKRHDKILFVPITQNQADAHQEYQTEVGKLVLKWRRMGFLNEKDRNRLILNLSRMRMVADSTYILDQQTRHDTKIGELMNILDEVFELGEEKVVVFSQWERMTRLVAEELQARNITFEYLHGSIPSKDRQYLLENFKNKPESKVFLSTDAGGVGLNLQSASMIINLDIPWNPAVLEQRIARVYRLGQERNVTVINMVSTGTIEHKMLDTLQFKGALAQGILDAGENTIFMGDDQFKKFMETVENLAEIEKNTEENIENTTEEDIAVEDFVNTESPDNEPIRGDDDIPTEEPKIGKQQSIFEKTEGTDGPASSPNENNPQQLIANGLQFFGQLFQTLQDPAATQNLVNSITSTDETGKTFLKIPIDNEATVQNALGLLGNLLKGLGK